MGRRAARLMGTVATAAVCGLALPAAALATEHEEPPTSFEPVLEAENFSITQQRQAVYDTADVSTLRVRRSQTAATEDLSSPIHATRGRRLVHDDFAKTGAKRLEFFPEPRRHVLDGGIFQAVDFVEIRVIELLHDRLHRVGNPGVIVNPAGRGLRFAFDGNLNLEAVPVHPAALMAFGRFRQRLRRFKLKVFREPSAHGRKDYTPRWVGVQMNLCICN